MSGQLYGHEDLLTAEHAALFRFHGGLSSMDYVRAVAGVIGSEQIHSVFNNGSAVKVYLKETTHVRTVVESGVLLKGRRVMAEFNVPPGDKVCLSNVDPLVPSWSLECLLNFYGTLESSIMCQRISHEAGFSHIQGSKRVVYMNIFKDKTLPSKLPLFYGDSLHEIDVQVENNLKHI